VPASGSSLSWRLPATGPASASRRVCLLRADRHLHRPRLCAAIAARLTFDARITGTGTGSCRLRTARARHQSARTV